MPLARKMVDIQSEFGRPLLFALRRLYKVSEFRGMGTFSLELRAVLFALCSHGSRSFQPVSFSLADCSKKRDRLKTKGSVPLFPFFGC